MMTVFRRVGDAQTLRFSPLTAFLWGLAVRVAYFSVTAYEERTYDLAGHIDYIMFVVRQFRIPPTGLGWEMHQPPLYYFLAGSWIKFNTIFLGRTVENLLLDIRLLSLLLSIVTLGCIVWIARLLFPGPSRRREAWILSIVVGTLPGIVMMATRINNDGLSCLISFLWCGFALRWWLTLRPRDFWIACALLALGVLTKLTAGALALPMALCILLHPRIGMRRKLFLAGSLCLLLALCTGWYFAFRSLQFFHMLATPGTAGLNDRLIMENHAIDFVLFNPLAIIQRPFTSPWASFMDRRYVWEYLLRSAFFGEWTFIDFLWPARALLAVALVGIAPFVVGVRRAWETWLFARPMTILLVTLLATLAAFRALHPCGCNQDFRYIPLVAVSVVAFAVHGFAFWGGRGERWACVWGVALALLQSAFLVSFFLF